MKLERLVAEGSMTTYLQPCCGPHKNMAASEQAFNRFRFDISFAVVSDEITFTSQQIFLLRSNQAGITAQQSCVLASCIIIAAEIINFTTSMLT